MSVGARQPDIRHPPALLDGTQRFMQTANRLPSLFDLDDQMVAILALIDDAETTGAELDAGLETQMELVETALAEKLEGYVSVIRTLQSLRDARKAEANRLRDRSATADRAADWLMNRLKVHLETTGQTHVETPRFTIRLQASPPRVDVLEEMLVPSEFKKTVITTTVDKRAVLERVKATGIVPAGVEVVHGSHVRLS